MSSISARRRVRAAGAVVASALVVAALVPASGASALNGANLLCDQHSVYGIDTSGAVKRIDVGSGTVTAEATFSGPDASGSTVNASNALGIVQGGRYAYAVQERGGAILRYDTMSSTSTVVATASAGNGQAVIRGAYDPANHLFYWATNGATATIGAYDTVSGQSVGVVGTVSGLSGNSGDLAFSTSGRLYVVAGDEVRRVDQADMPTTAGNAALTTTRLTSLPSGTSSPGIAFSSDGYLYVASSAGLQSDAKLFEIDPATGTSIATIPLGDTAYIPRDLASCNYADTAAGTTTVTERVRPTDQFTVTVGGGATQGNAATTDGTATSATAGPVLAVAGTAITVTQSPAGDTKPEEYTTGWACRRTSESGSPVIASGDGSTASFTMPPAANDGSGRGTDVVCTFTNTPKQAGLRLDSALGGSRIAGADQFAVTALDRDGSTLNPASSATTTGSGATVQSGTGTTDDLQVVVGRPYRLVQTMAGGSASDYGQYAKTITCTDANRVQTGLPSGADYDGSLTITPVPGAAITCTVTAAAAPASLTMTTTLGEARYAQGDQLTAGIHPGDASRAAVGTSAGATTAGDGDQVTPGTGTTTLDPVTAGTTYALTDAFGTNAGRYSRTISCRDDAGYQQGMPSGAFADDASITPVPGARITCTVDAVLKGSGLSVGTALADRRFDDGDQFAAAIRTGGPTGTVASTGTATTAGTGDSVQPGTGATDRLATARGTTYTITDAASGHAERYEQTITCVDRNRQQQGLPTAAAFPGSYDLVAEPGADLDCTVTAAAKHAVIAVGTRFGSHRFASGDQVTTGLRDGSGTDLGEPSSETSAGDGDAVTTGTGTTGDVPVRRGLAYELVGDPTAHADRYDRSLRCTDANGLQGDLVVADLAGGASLTPEAGTRFACTVTATLKPAALTATEALGSARADEGDQWTVAWRTGGAAGPVLDGGSGATTTGSGATVASGTGVSGPVAATNAVPYTLTVTDPGRADRYASRLTCEDANGLQTGLPHDVDFTGSAVVAPEAGADVRCTVTATARPAALAVQLSGPAAQQVDQPTTWTADLRNDGGAAALGAVSFALPAGLTLATASGTGWTCTTRDRVVDCTGPALAGGATDAVRLDLVAARGAEGPAAVRAAVDPAGAAGTVDPAACRGRGVPVAGCDVASTVVGSTPHLVLGITAPSSAAVGAPATWRLSVANDGTGAAGSATVALRLPDGLQAVTADGADCSISDRDAVCRVPGPIATGSSAAFTVAAVPAAGTAGRALALMGRLDPAGSATTGDPAACTATGAPQGCAVSRPVTPAAGVALDVSIAAPAQLTAGVPAPYAVAVVDRGTGPAAAPVVSVHLPDGLTYRSATGADCVRTGADLRCTLPSAVPAGGAATFVVTVQPAADSAGTTVAPAAGVDPADGTPPACTGTPLPSGCVAADPRTVQQPTGLLLTGSMRTLAPASGALVAGDRVRYAYTVTNRTGSSVDRLVVAVPGLPTARCAARTLAVGASTTCVLGPVTVTQAQVDAGAVTREAVATAVPTACDSDCASATSNTVTLRAPVRTVARITAVQTVHLHDRNGDGIAQLGERVDFSVRVVNTGTVTLHGVALDDPLVHLVCPRTTLAVGASMVCTGSRITTAEDVAAGGIRNLATASARGVARLGTVSSQRTVGEVAANGPATRLAHTGSSLPGGLLAGLALLGLGGVLLAATRRRRRDA